MTDFDDLAARLDAVTNPNDPMDAAFVFAARLARELRLKPDVLAAVEAALSAAEVEAERLAVAARAYRSPWAST